METGANPFTPSGGAAPALLVGRQSILAQLAVHLGTGTSTRNDAAAPRAFVFSGLRGSGKTVLLRHSLQMALAHGWQVVDYSAVAANARAVASLGELARLSGRGVLLAMDDLHRLPPRTALNFLAAMAVAPLDGPPVRLVATALPSIGATLDRSPALRDRFVQRLELAAFADAEAAALLINTAAASGMKFEASALALLVKAAHGNARYLQQLGHAAWEATEGSPIRRAAAAAAIPVALAAIDADIYMNGSLRLTAQEQRYLRALAELGPGAQGSGATAARAGRKVTELAPVRSSLVNKGLLYAPAYGHTAFTTPGFERYVLQRLAG